MTQSQDAEMASAVTATQPSRRPSRPTAALVAVAVVTLLVAGYWLMTQGPGRQILSPPGSIVTEFSGDSDLTSEPFQVREGWAIQWESKGDHFAFAIRGDRDFGTIIDVDEPGSGVTSPTGAGTFHLEVTSSGPWSIKIAQGE